ncbi:hypothetical protein SNE40_021298 [Patella caerulea]|uniref:Peptidase A2 domain-containing protein n=1 Tax=Patella caerulea TaxID=87958 RepID=A0AAN8IXD1_PATCE
MEADTGASVSVMSYEDYTKILGNRKLEPTKQKLHTYTGYKIEVKGQIMVNVQHQNDRQLLPLIIIKADKYARPLMGRDWLSALKIEWWNLLSEGQYSIQGISLEELKKNYAEIFSEQLIGVKV